MLEDEGATIISVVIMYVDQNFSSIFILLTFLSYSSLMLYQVEQFYM